MNIYVGNLSHDLTEEELRQKFAPFGEVASVNIIKDKHGGQSKGFGFVEMPSNTEAEAAITSLKGEILKERTMDVSQARPRSDSRGGRQSYRKGGKGRQRRF